MTFSETRDLYDQGLEEELIEDRPVVRVAKYRLRKRPDYCKKREPIRKSMNLRSNLRKIRW
jgi:hypothetical protein